MSIYFIHEANRNKLKLGIIDFGLCLDLDLKYQNLYCSVLENAENHQDSLKPTETYFNELEKIFEIYNPIANVKEYMIKTRNSFANKNMDFRAITKMFELQLDYNIQNPDALFLFLLSQCSILSSRYYFVKRSIN